jgi:hypothetical protein
MRVATTVWRLSPELIEALDEQLGPPVDGYVNGTQTWLTDTGPGDATLEWRLHPVAGFRPVGGVSPYELWDEVTGQLLCRRRVRHGAGAVGGRRVRDVGPPA